MSEWVTAHRDLSEWSERFARHLHACPERIEPLDLDTVDIVQRHWPLNQRVPLLVDEDFHGRLAEASLRGGKLLIEAPKRLAQKAPELAAAFFGMSSAAVAKEVLVDNGFYDIESYRLDILRGPGGFKIVEANAGCRSSGFYAQDWLDIYTSVPPTARFLEQNDLRLSCIDTLAVFIDAFVEKAMLLPGCRDSGEVGVAIIMEERFQPGIDALINARLAPVADAWGLRGRVRVLSSAGEIRVSGGRASARGAPVDILIRCGPGGIDRSLYDLQLAGAFLMFDTPTCYFSMDKRNFALLTAQRPKGWYRDDEIATIDELIPWTSLMTATDVTYDGRSWKLRDLAFAAKDQFVLKESRGWGGHGVVVGAYASNEDWRAAFDAHAGDPQWLLQMFWPSWPYLLNDPHAGICEHDVVWGYFVIGGKPGGGTIRVRPHANSNGVINVAAGGTEGLFCLC